ncbi:MAG TPA: class I SAM-dependent methyltransferase [Acidimicrobiales bacterium]|nr:class I SAM-dependent methyltransferase [Acidimicrobiales bacterium]
MTANRWNSNIHAFDRLLERVPAGAKRGLDVGCGEGEMARRLRQRVQHVTAIDPDESSIAEARSFGDDIAYEIADLQSAHLAAGSFDVVSAVAVLHHMDHREGLTQLASLVAPGGLLLVVGLARSRTPSEYARDALDAVAIRPYTFTRRVWETPAPKIWPPPVSYAEARRLSEEVLPGVEYRRAPFFRYTLTWVNRAG